MLQPRVDQPSLSRSELAARLHQACILKGEFLLRSGQVSDIYFDKYQFESRPELLGSVAEQLAVLIPTDTEVLGGLELGGVPIATALSLHTGLPVGFVRKVAKTYGTARLAEGAEIDGRRVLVVEDVITTGGQVAESIAALRERGAIVENVLCVIDRSGGNTTALDGASVRVTALFTRSELEAAGP